jgi:threonine aldolase
MAASYSTPTSAPMGRKVIELFSDTMTRPSAGMRKAMAEAEVGDEQKAEDPTTRRLEERVAELLGTPAAVFLPSGTMCNQIALAVHCRAGDEIITPAIAHITNFEAGGGAAIAGAQNREVVAVNGIFGPAALADCIRNPAVRHFPRSRLVAIEQTVNLGGGLIWPLEEIAAVTALATAHGLVSHLDGARLLNASVATGIAAARYAGHFTSSWIDLSKGLGCPIGAVLAGSKEFIADAWRWKHRLGGAMRQSGILAAAGLYALDHNVERLADDHANARHFASLIADVPDIRLVNDRIETNIVLIDTSKWSAETGRTAADLAERCIERGVRIGALSPTLMRAVTHLDVTASEIEPAARAFRLAVSL